MRTFIAAMQNAKIVTTFHSISNAKSPAQLAAWHGMPQEALSIRLSSQAMPRGKLELRRGNTKCRVGYHPTEQNEIPQN